jgi:hypothetical protein
MPFLEKTKRIKMSNGQWSGGKGSKPRPITDKKQFEDNWDKIFKKPKPEKQDDTKQTPNGDSKI